MLNGVRHRAADHLSDRASGRVEACGVMDLVLAALERGGDQIRPETADHQKENKDRRISLVIAIDGPAAAGKTTVANELSHRISALLFDTGSIYRALALVALERGIDPNDAVALAKAAKSLPIRIELPSANDGRASDVLVDHRDVTWAIRSPDVDRIVSRVSAHREVRDALLEVQRSIGRSGRVVMVGRDIGTVVMPDADFKIWLDASLEERARRRVLDLQRIGKPRSYEQVRDDMAARDGIDSGRSVAPMKAAADAVVIITDGLTASQVVDRIIELIGEEATTGANL